ncbi:hypothetical protein KY290_000291 [Solanum tuberosum]|uniref:F-box domain-containing protein n=1 Tax=Solanum tuberosum TaxID=4113 RepID=A0ABQ7WJ21_SOLTU|nr:hypothetical protein KY290_000291 [Solanum tuberosum]
MEPLSLKPRDKEGTDRDFEGAGVSSKEEQDIIQKAKLFNQICEGICFFLLMESVVTPSNKTNHIGIVDHDQIDDSVETNLLDTFLETLVGRDDAASTTKALALLEANSGIEVCQRLLKNWKQLRPLTQKFIALVAEVKQTNEHLSMNELNKAEKDVKVLDEENEALEESSDTSIRLYKKTKHTHVSCGKAHLPRLPLLPLLRFKCVSKNWKTLISDPYFNMKHQRHHKNNLNSQKLLVAVDKVTFFSSSSLSTFQLVEDIQNLDCPTNSIPDHYCHIYGSCNGLVLVGIFDRYDKQLLLWNPSMRESTVLPRPEFVTRYSTFGLGYDATSDDYKVLKLDQGYSDDIHLQPSYEILALKSDSWRKIRNYPSRISNTGYTLEIEPKFDEDHNMEPLAFLNGAFHWVGFSGVLCIVSFSSSSDNMVFGEISLPEPPTFRIYRLGMNSDYGVSVLGGMLCFYCTHYQWQMDGIFKLWIMKDYGVKESWTEIFTLKETRFHSIIPKYWFADGEFLLCCKLDGHSVFRTSKGPFGLWPQIGIHQDGVVYTESLISPKSLLQRVINHV